LHRSVTWLSWNWKDSPPKKCLKMKHWLGSTSLYFIDSKNCGLKGLVDNTTIGIVTVTFTVSICNKIYQETFSCGIQFGNCCSDVAFYITKIKWRRKWCALCDMRGMLKHQMSISLDSSVYWSVMSQYCAVILFQTDNRLS
jgi:hypothetical protein